jgi:CheY-like chemotaxis protein
MSNRGLEASFSRCALWNRKTARTAPVCRRVLVAHADKSIGESIVLLLGLKGFSAQHALDASALRFILDSWRPQAVFLDTRIGGAGNYALVREMCAHGEAQDRLLIAMSSFLPKESVESMKAAGYDGHSRRPCPMWQMADLLDGFYASAFPR